MKLFCAVIVLVLGMVFRLDAMKIEDQELVAVSIYKRACEIGLVSQEAINFVRNMDRWSNTSAKSSKKYLNSQNQKKNGEPKENFVKIDLIRLFTKAVVESWKESFSDPQFYNNPYMNFLSENGMPLYDIVALYQILNNSVHEGVNPSKSLAHVKKSGNIQVFEEMFFENLKLSGLEKGFYRISKKRFDRITGMGEKLILEKNMTIKEYQREKMQDPVQRDPKKFVVKEEWMRNLYREAVMNKIIPEKKLNVLSSSDEKIGVNPINVLTSAMFQFASFDMKVSDFLLRYGVRDINIFRMTPLIQSFFNSDSKIVRSSNDGRKVTEIIIPTLDGMQYILHNITSDLAEIGISNKVYYISRDSLTRDQ